MVEAIPFTECDLMLTEDCNLRCKYCYENAARCNSSYMSFNTAKKAADFLIDNAQKNGQKNLEINFFGGEPLLNLDVMISFFHYAVDKANKCNVKLFFSLMTNGTIYNEKIEKFFLDWYRTIKNIKIQISTDGIPQVQDKYRRAQNDKPTSEIVLENILKLKKLFKKNKIEISSFHTHSVITKDNISSIFLSYKYFRQLGIKKLEFMLSDEENWSEDDVSIYIEQMSLISDYVYQECISSHSLNPYEQAKNIISINNYDKIRQRNFCTAGKTFCTITPTGDIYPCARMYFYNRSFRIGNVINNTVDNEIRKVFFDIHQSDMHSENINCGECKNAACKICIAYNYQINGDVLKCNTLLCSMYKAKWNFITETKKKFDKLGSKLNYNKCNEVSFFEVSN
ncbi:MAG: radical SAM protein [Deltaproteobacteria bacterium]